MRGRRRLFTSLSYGWEEEVIHSIELWVGGGGHSLYSLFTNGWEEEVILAEEEEEVINI